MGLPISGLTSGSSSVLSLTKPLYTLYIIIIIIIVCQAAASRSDSQTNPTISRAQATFTLFGCLPASSNRLPFLLNRRKQRVATSIYSGAQCAWRNLTSLLNRVVRGSRAGWPL